LQPEYFENKSVVWAVELSVPAACKHQARESNIVFLLTDFAGQGEQ
jgi:hypothetical protein